MSQQPLYGAETRKAIENFPISGEPVPASVIHWLARIKGAAAAVNGELGLLKPSLARRIVKAAAAVATGAHDDQFPIDVFQTGSGTSSNMNANEVIATLAGAGVHPNDHVNLGQSSNDVFPSAVHLAALEEASRRAAAGACRARARARREGATLRGHRQGRPHPPDGRRAGDARSGVRGLRRPGPPRARPHRRCAAACRADPARRHRDRHRAQHSPAVRGQGAPAPERGVASCGSRRPRIPSRRQGNRDALVELSGALKVVAVSLTKIAQDLALMGSGPRAGIGELFLPELQKGSSIMPGKVNPVIPEVVMQVAAQVVGNDTAITIGGMQGNFELNVRVPLIARNLLESIALLTSAATVFAERCVKGIEANRAGATRSAEATLAVATALNPYIGYDAATVIVQEATRSGRALREVAREHGVSEAVLDEALDLRKMALGG